MKTFHTDDDARLGIMLGELRLLAVAPRRTADALFERHHDGSPGFTPGTSVISF